VDEDHAAGLLDDVEVVALTARLRDEDRLVELADLDQPSAADARADRRVAVAVVRRPYGRGRARRDRRRAVSAARGAQRRGGEQGRGATAP
jgi:hypothetical protein